VAVEAATPPAAPRERTVPFSHPEHADVRCADCHTTRVTLAPPDSVATCTSCHLQHHEPARTCALCHRTDATLPAHATLDDAHGACTSCHASATVARLEPARAFCLSCHPASTDHYAPRECSTCHFQAEPAALRPRLTTAGTGQ
jgi:hypothetical protein